jgi:hypothetical protein
MLEKEVSPARSRHLEPCKISTEALAIYRGIVLI